MATPDNLESAGRHRHLRDHSRTVKLGSRRGEPVGVTPRWPGYNAEPMSNLQLKSRWLWDVLIVQCAGRIVAGVEAQNLHDEVRNNFPHLPHVVLAMDGVQFIESSGLGTIVRLMSAARAAGGDLKICQLPEMIRKVLSITKLQHVFEIYETEDEAILAALRAKRPGAGSQPEQSRPAVLCVDESPNVLAYLAELLKKEGLRPITANNLADAQVLMKARAPKLILANARLSARGRTAAQIFAECCPGVKFLDLGETFSTHDAGEAGVALLAQVRSVL
jgi:anti-anti-sigma factor